MVINIVPINIEAKKYIKDMYKFLIIVSPNKIYELYKKIELYT